jgi:hypothetical protein
LCRHHLHYQHYGTRNNVVCKILGIFEYLTLELKFKLWNMALTVPFIYFHHWTQRSIQSPHILDWCVQRYCQLITLETYSLKDWDNCQYLLYQYYVQHCLLSEVYLNKNFWEELIHLLSPHKSFIWSTST